MPPQTPSVVLASFRPLLRLPLPPAWRRLVTDFAYLLTGHAFVRLVSFVATLYVTKTLGPAEFGTLSVGISLAAVFGVCSNLGLDDLIVRQVARDADGGATLLGDAVVLKLLALPAGALGVLALSLARSGDAPLYGFLFLYAVCFSYLLLVCAVCRGQRRMAVQSLLLGTNVLLVAAASALAARLTGRAAPVGAGYALAAVATLCAGYVVLRRSRFLPHFAWQPGRWRAVLRTAVPFAAALIGLMVFDRLALVSVTVVLGPTAAGWFSAGYNVVLGLTIIPGLAVAAVYPVLARTAGQRTRPDGATAAVAAPLLLFAAGGGLALGAALALGAPVAVPRLYGQAYLPSVAVLQALAPGVPCLFLVLALTGVLEATDWQRAGAAAVGAGLLVAVPLCPLATRLWGIAGAAVAYDLGYALLAGIMLALAGRAVGWGHLLVACRRWPGPPAGGAGVRSARATV
jgi:O-antigen/teichoic acid export membrane protein